MFKQALIYLACSVLSGLIPFFLLPILTRYLSADEYGEVAMFLIFVGLLNALIGLSVHGASTRRFFENDVTTRRIAIFNGNCLIILLLTFVLSLVLVFILGGYLEVLFTIPKTWLYQASICVVFSFLLNFRLVQWQIRNCAYKYGLYQISNALMTFILTTVLVIKFDLGAEGRVWALVFSASIFGGLSIYSLYKDNLILFFFNISDIKYALKFGVPLVPHVCGALLLMSIDRYIINQKLGLSYAGLYMVLINLGNAVNMIFNSVNRAYTPWLYNSLRKDCVVLNNKIVFGTYCVFATLFLGSIVNFYVSPWLYTIVTGSMYHEVAYLLPIIIQGQIFFGMYLLVTNYLFYAKKTKYISLITMLSGILNVSLILLFIDEYKLSGVAYAFLISSLFRFFITWIVSNYFYPMPWVRFFKVWRSNV